MVTKQIVFYNAVQKIYKDYISIVKSENMLPSDKVGLINILHNKLQQLEGYNDFDKFMKDLFIQQMYDPKFLLNRGDK